MASDRDGRASRKSRSCNKIWRELSSGAVRAMKGVVIADKTRLMCVCERVCVCVFVRVYERGRERACERKRERKEKKSYNSNCHSARSMRAFVFERVCVYIR